MRFSDYWYLKNQILPASPEEVQDPEFLAQEKFEFDRVMQGKYPMQIPGPAGWWDSGMWLNWRGPQQFLDNLAFFRKGLKPWQRGLEIGMAHGHFIIGPFVSYGPLRNTEEAATVGLIAGIVCILA